MKIPDPKAMPGKYVLCFNNRSKQFEPATMCSAAYRLPNDSGNGGGWTYECVLERRSPLGNYMCRSVGDAGIK